MNEKQKKALQEWTANLVEFLNSQEGAIGEDELEGFLENIPMPEVFDDMQGSATDNISAYFDRIQSDPEFASMVYDKKNRQKFTTALGLANDIITTGAEISDAKEQIRQSEKAIDELQKPTTPSALTKNPKLKAAMRRAELDLAGEGDAAFLSPYERAAQDQYAKDIAVAKTASTGQAGAFGSMAQTAAQRRRQGSRELVPLLQQKRQQDFANMQGLIGQDIQEDQFINRSNLSRYGQELGQYNLERGIAGRVGSAGRLNKALGRRTMGNRITDLLGDPMYDALPMKAKTYLNPVMNKFKNDLS
jgi:hypothetical protein